MANANNKTKTVETLKHDDATRKNIPTAEYQSVLEKEQQNPKQVRYPRNTDLDPQLVWRGKDEQDWSDLVVHAPPLYIQEKIHPKVLIDDLLRHSSLSTNHSTESWQPDLFADFNGIPQGVDKTEFYQHDQNWSNRMILGDSLQVMASLAEREGLRGKVQCIYIDPPYGIKFNSNFQWSTTSRDVKDGKVDHITREPEQVKAFRDTWREGIHSYLTYLRDRLTVARDLLTDSGSIFVQIGDENVHRVRAVMDEVFGEENCVSQITFVKTGGLVQDFVNNKCDFILWFAKHKTHAKARHLYAEKRPGEHGGTKYNGVELPDGTRITLKQASEKFPDAFPPASRIFRLDKTTSEANPVVLVTLRNCEHQGSWKTTPNGMARLELANRISPSKQILNYVRYIEDFPVHTLSNVWDDIGGIQSRADPKIFVVQTATEAIKRCLLLATDPGDLVLDPTCGSGTTATVAEQWGRRWITIDTSRVALALARARIMGARYPFYLLVDSIEGQLKEAEVTRTAPSSQPVQGNIRHGFVYERVPHITLKSIANNAEIDVIWEKFQPELEFLRAELNTALNMKWEEWEIPRESASVEQTFLSASSTAKLPPKDRQECLSHILKLHSDWWHKRIARQKEIDASISAKADVEYLYDKPYEDKKTVRVAGPFTVESLSPHRVLGVDEDDELIDTMLEGGVEYGKQSFPQMVLENLKTAGVQQAHKEDRITFTSLVPWPGELVCAEGRFEASGEWLVKGDQQEKYAINHSSLSTDSGTEIRAGIFIGPEFGTVQRADLVAAAREAGDAGFDVLIVCAFNYEAHTTEFKKLGRIPVLKARMNADLHMAEDLKNTGKGNLFVIFGEPDIEVASEEWLVDSSERRIAPYEIYKLISGVNSLAEINRLGGADLRDYAQLSCRREIWDYITNATGSDLRPGKHRRRAGPQEHGGVSTIAWHCAGIAGGVGNLSDLVRKAGTSFQEGLRKLIEQLCQDQQNAKRIDQIAIHSPLTTRHYFQVTVNGVDVFKPQTGEVESCNTDGIACWFIDTDYNEESFFVRHAYFLGANDPYSALKTTLKAEINADAWATLNSDTSRPFEKPKSGRIAIKVINHLGDEVMKVFRVNP